MSEIQSLTFEILKKAVESDAAAFRCVTEYQPVGGAGDKVFPPTYKGGEYAVETRIIGAERVDCVLLDSVQAQANRMELALLQAYRAKKINLPLLTTRFEHEALRKNFVVTSLEAPHRIADAIFRDSMLNGVMFRRSDRGRLLDTADVRNATGLFGLCPTALVFGLWDSAGPRGGLGAKFQRALVSEIVGYAAIAGVKTSSRIDPLQIITDAGPVYDAAEEDVMWTLDPERAKKNKSGKPIPYGSKETDNGQVGHKKINSRTASGGTGAEGKKANPGQPTKINHSNIPPEIKTGGFTISKAIQTTVLSLAVLRRLSFPLNGSSNSDTAIDNVGRSVLAALGLTAATLARTDADLRSRCQLFPQHQSVWELLDTPGLEPKRFSLTSENAFNLLNTAIVEVRNANLPWEGEIELIPSDELVKLVRRSQEIGSSEDAEGE